MSAITVGKTSINQWCVRVGVGSYYRVFKTRDEADEHAAQLESTTIAVPRDRYDSPEHSDNVRRVYALAMADMQGRAFTIRFRLVRGHVLDAFRRTITNNAGKCVQAMLKHDRASSAIRESQRLTEVQGELERAIAYGEAVTAETYLVLAEIAKAFGYPVASDKRTAAAEEPEEKLETVADAAEKAVEPKQAATGRRRRSIRFDDDCTDDGHQVQ